MGKKKNVLLAAVAVFVCVISVNAQEHAAESSLRGIIARNHAILCEDDWYGFHRVKFDFGGHEAWVVEPSVEPAPGHPWTWTMQWAEAFVRRTGVLELLEGGFHHVTINLFDSRACDDSLQVFAAFQDYLVNELGFAPKARLVGMSWGGFFSIRYASAYPEKVGRIYLDAPLLNLDGFNGDIGPWKDLRHGDFWTEDPRMPVNMAGNIANAEIPVLLLYGGQDQTVNPALNSERFLSRMKDEGGDIKAIFRGGYGHHPHGLDPGDTGAIVNFFCK